MRMLPRALFAVALAVVIPACGGDDGGTGDDTPDIDATPVRELAGTWRALPSNFDAVPRPIEARNKLVFGTGTLAITVDGQTRNVMYTVADDLYTYTSTDGTEPTSEGSRFHIAGDVLLDNAMTPATPGTLTTTWTERGTREGLRFDVKWELHADLTVSATYDQDAGPIVLDGTYQVMGDDVFLQITDDDDITRNYLATMLDGYLGVPYEAI